MKQRQILAAGIVRDIRFANEHLYQRHLERLDALKVKYEILERWPCEDGTFLARIIQQYNSSPLIQLYED